MRLLSPALISLAACASAQFQTPTQRIQEALTPLRDYTSATIQVFGFEYLGSTTNELQTDIYWRMPLGKDYVEVLTQKNRVYTQRIVGDGTALWSYDPARNEYSSSIYGVYNGQQPQNYRANLLASTNFWLKGTASYGGRLLNEIYGGEMAIYRSWVPISGEPLVYENGQSYRNPINQQNYPTIPMGRDYVIYELGNPVRKVVMFERVYGPLPSGADGWRIGRVIVNEVTRLGNNTRTLDLAVSFFGGSVPTTASFVFQPPAGAKSIAGPRPVGG